VYLLGAIRGIALALAAQLEVYACPTHSLADTVDAVIDGWLLLLPKLKQELVSGDGKVDELVFQVHMAIHA
jgi:hypothetical protein